MTAAIALILGAIIVLVGIGTMAGGTLIDVLVGGLAVVIGLMLIGRGR
jgi:hypothetical protein